MTREELLRVSKPILFNTEMVRAIVDDRKTATRRVIKKEKVDAVLSSDARKNNPDIPDEDFIKLLVNVPYHKGKTLYVRETFRPLSSHPGAWVEYAADWSPKYFENSRDPKTCNGGKWYPSLHMPKKFARIFLKVTDVRVEQLQDMTLDDFLSEGVVLRPEAFNDPENAFQQARDVFVKIWDSTIKKEEIYLYGWDGNPWVWVIEFERIFPEDY